MSELIQTQVLFYFTLVVVMFLPGYFLLLALFASRTGVTNAGHSNFKALEPLERFVLSFGLSIVSVDLILFLYSKLGILITRTSILLGIFLFIAICFGIYKFYVIAIRQPAEKQSHNLKHEIATVAVLPRNDDTLFSFSKNQFVLFLLLLFLTFFIKTAYLSNAIAPTATDMGHHMYWSKWITENGKLPDYADSIITKEDVGKFIIGEHTIFATMSIVGNLDFFSAFPPVILYLINLLGILAVFLLVLQVTKNKNIAIFSLLFLGVLYAISSPQEKYVSGGVVGNIFGNFLMPLVLYLFYRSFSIFNGEGNEPEAKKFLSLAIFIFFGLLYTHHLTAFILIFIFLLLLPLYFALNYRDLEEILKKASRIIFNPYVISTFVLGLIFFFFIFTPSYMSPTAIDTAVGAPTKSTRTGLSIANLKETVGEARIALGFLGLLLLALNFKRKNFGYALLAAWTIMLFIMSAYPQLLFVDIPSARIGNYLSYPLAILSAFGFYSIFHPEKSDYLKDPASSIPAFILKSIFVLVFVFVLVSGLSDSASAFKSQSNSKEAAETFNASRYVAKNLSEKDIVLKDHNYLTADAWIKLFFMRSYTFPLSRGYFKRYEDLAKPREMCTLEMISNPAGDKAADCFSKTDTNIIMINPKYDSAQFQRLSNFDQVYMNNDVGIYYRKN